MEENGDSADWSWQPLTPSSTSALRAQNAAASDGDGSSGGSGSGGSDGHKFGGSRQRRQTKGLVIEGVLGGGVSREVMKGR